MLIKLDAGIKEVYDRSVGGDVQGAWDAVAELGPTATEAHVTLTQAADEFEAAGMPRAKVDAIRAVADGALGWSRLDREMRHASAGRGFTPELADLFQQRLLDVYVAWRAAEDTLHDAGGL